MRHRDSFSELGRVGFRLYGQFLPRIRLYGLLLYGIFAQGASIFDVRTRGGEGVHGKADEGNRGCVNVTVTRAGGGKKIRDFCGRHIWKAPYTVSFSWDKREPYIQNPVFYGILPSLADRADTHVCLTHPEYIEESDSWLREAGFVNKATG